jgi:hypothetical protein
VCTLSTHPFGTFDFRLVRTDAVLSSSVTIYQFVEPYHHHHHLVMHHNHPPRHDGHSMNGTASADHDDERTGSIIIIKTSNNKE